MTIYKNIAQQSNSFTRKVRGLSASILQIMKVTPYIKNVTKRLGKSHKFISVYCHRLIKQNLIRRVSYGKYVLVGGIGGVGKKYIQVIKKPHIRLHALQFKLRIFMNQKRQIWRVIRNNPKFFHLSRINENCKIFEYSGLKGEFCKDDLILSMPRGSCLRAATMSEMKTLLLSTIARILKKWTRKFRMQYPLYKPNRWNFSIVNCHYAYLNPKLSLRLEELGFINYKEYDSTDNKLRFVIDKSEGLPEIECVHPKISYLDMCWLEKWILNGGFGI